MDQIKVSISNFSCSGLNTMQSFSAKVYIIPRTYIYICLFTENTTTNNNSAQSHNGLTNSIP